MANGKHLSGDLARCARIFGGGKLLAAPWSKQHSIHFPAGFLGLLFPGMNEVYNES